MAREGLQFTQDRLKAGSWDLSETSKSSSVSGQYRIILSAAAAGAVLKPQGGNCAVLPQQTQPNFVLAKDPLFSLLSDAPQELVQIEIGKGEPEIRGGAGGGDKKAIGISAANPHPVVKGERRPVGGRAIHQTHTRRRKHRKPFAGARCTHRAAKKREPCAANLPSLPQGAHPAARPRRKQGHAKQIIAQKQENATKKANFAAKLRSVCAEDHKRAVKVYKRDRCQKEN